MATFVLERATDDVPMDAPPDLARALDAHPGAKAQSDAITPKAREERVRWVTGARKAEQRAARVGRTCGRLAEGARRPSD